MNEILKKNEEVIKRLREMIGRFMVDFCLKDGMDIKSKSSKELFKEISNKFDEEKDRILFKGNIILGSYIIKRLSNRWDEIKKPFEEIFVWMKIELTNDDDVCIKIGSEYKRGIDGVLIEERGELMDLYDGVMTAVLGGSKEFKRQLWELLLYQKDVVFVNFFNNKSMMKSVGIDKSGFYIS